MKRDTDPEPVCARCGHYFSAHVGSGGSRCTMRVDPDWRCPCEKPLDNVSETWHGTEVDTAMGLLGQ